MSDQKCFVIVGGGLAGAKAAETLRAEGFTGRVVLIGAEDELPYERPPLSKGLLLKSEERDSIYVHDRDWYRDNGIELRLGAPATAIDRAAHEVHVGDEKVPYDKLLLACGSVLRTLMMPGYELDGICYLRTLADSDRIDAAITADAKVVIIGAGWIGLEVASAARQRGAAVTIVEADDVPMRRTLGPEIGAVFADLHREHGVELRLGLGVSEVRGDGKVESVVLSDGSELPADVVVIGVGVAPATGLAQAAGLDVDRAVLVDAGLRTSDPDIYAAGDLASTDHAWIPGRVRVEHWANALAQGPAAGRSMLGQDVHYDEIPFFFSDQYDLGLEYAGHVPGGEYDRVVFRGDLPAREFIAFWIKDDRVLAAMNVNVWDVTDDLQALIRSGKAVDDARLVDPDVAIADLP